MDHYIEKRVATSPLFDEMSRTVFDLPPDTVVASLEKRIVETPKMRRGGVAVGENTFKRAMDAGVADHLFEIGANNGRHTRDFLDRFDAHIHSFEPNVALFPNFSDLSPNSRLSFNPFALSDCAGASRFTIVDSVGAGETLNKRVSGMSSLEDIESGYSTLYGTANTHVVVAATVTGEEYVKLRGLEGERTALWIDVEGHAPQVLAGFGQALDSVQIVHCEVETVADYTGRATADAVVGTLRRHGLEVMFRDYQYYGRFNILAVRPDTAAMSAVAGDLDLQAFRQQVAKTSRTLSDA